MRVRSSAIAVATAAILAFLPGTALAFRCGTRLVHEGDSAGEVRAKCGEPTEVHQSAVLRPPVFWRHGRAWQVPGGAIERPVETWTYNLGPNRLMRRLRLEDGIVVEIDTLGYGYL